MFMFIKKMFILDKILLVSDILSNNLYMRYS